ncbi:MAG: flagellar basal body-associated FliL family protein [Pseudomonadota bacterium]
MAVTEPSGAEDAASPKGSSKLPIVLGLLLAALLGGGGFFVAYSGLLPFGSPSDEVAEIAPAPTEITEAVSFVPLEPMVVSLGNAGQGRHLRFRAEVEVVPGREAEVRAVMPRLVDTLNGYLRAVPVAEFETPSALVRLRAQMLRRVQLVTPEGSVRDLLIMEFVLS